MGGNASTIAEEANVDAAAREGRESHGNRHYNRCPKPRTNRALRSGAIAIFSVLTPPSEGGQNCTKRAQVGSFNFSYVSIIYI